MLRRRRRKMMMLRRKTNPKTGKHTLCEPARSKRTWTFHKEPFCVEIYEQMPDPKPATHVLCEPAQAKRTWPATHVLCEPAQAKRTMHISREPFCGDLQEKCWTPTPGTAFCASLRSRNAHGKFHKSHFVWRFTGQMPDPKPATHVLCKPAQAKRTCTFHENHFVEIYRKNAGPQPRARHFVRACAIKTHMDISQEPSCVEIYRKKCRTPRRPPRSSRKNPFRVATLFGEKNLYSTPSIKICQSKGLGPTSADETLGQSPAHSRRILLRSASLFHEPGRPGAMSIRWPRPPLGSGPLCGVPHGFIWERLLIVAVYICITIVYTDICRNHQQPLYTTRLQVSEDQTEIKLPPRPWHYQDSTPGPEWHLLQLLDIVSVSLVRPKSHN